MIFPVNRVTRTRHVLAVNDLGASVAHWVDVLGFVIEWQERGWACLTLDAFGVMLGECPDERPARETGSHSYCAYVDVVDADALHRAMSVRGARVLAGPTDKAWGMREFLVETPDGHRIQFGQPLKRAIS